MNVLRANWDRIEGKCATTKAELDRAAALSSALIQAVGLREQGDSELGDVAEMRARAYSVFVGTYHEVRRAVAYLRGSESDVDSIIPSLYASRARRAKKAKEPLVEDTTSTSQSEAPATDTDESPSAPINNVVTLRPSTPSDPGTEQTG